MRLFKEGDWVRLRAAVRARDWEGGTHIVQPGTEGQVIVATDAHAGRQIVEFPLDVLGDDGRPHDIPTYVDIDLTDDQLEPAGVPRG